MKKNIIVIVVTMFLFSNMVFGRYERMHYPGTDEYTKNIRSYRILDDFELTQEQRENIQDVILEYKKKIIKAKSEVKLAKIGLREAFKKNKSAKNIRSKSKKLNEAENKVFNLKINKKLDIRNELTEEQRKEFSKRKSYFTKEYCPKDNHHGSNRYKNSKYRDYKFRK